MTIATELRRAGPYAGNGVTVAFPFSFKVFAAGDVLVVRTDDDGDTELALTTDYGVTLATSQDAQPGGTVALTAPLPAGAQLTILSRVAALQPTELTNQGGFYPQVITRALDRATILIQQQAEKLARSLVLSPTETSTDIPAPSLRRGGKILGFNRDTGAFEVQGGDAFIGAPGAADNTYVSLLTFKASDIGRKTASLVGVPGVTDGRFNWTAGNFTGRANDTDIIKADSTALSVGAWVRQRADGTNFDGRSVAAKLMDSISVRDARFAGGAKGDGIADDTAAVLAADAAAALLGKIVDWPAGRYRIKPIQAKASWRGEGARRTFVEAFIDALNPAPNSVGFNPLVTWEAPNPDTFCSSMSFDGKCSADPTTWTAANFDTFTGYAGPTMNNAVNPRFLSCGGQNISWSAFRFYRVSGGLIDQCSPQRMRGKFGDGILVLSSVDTTTQNCHPTDYTRGGVVYDRFTESEPLCQRSTIRGCNPSYGHHASINFGGTEYNFGVWAENAVNTTVDACKPRRNPHRGIIVASGGRTAGFDGARAYVNITNCDTDGGDAGIAVSSLLDMPIDARIIGCSATGATIAYYAEANNGGDSFTWLGCHAEYDAQSNVGRGYAQVVKPGLTVKPTFYVGADCTVSQFRKNTALLITEDPNVALTADVGNANNGGAAMKLTIDGLRNKDGSPVFVRWHGSVPHDITVKGGTDWHCYYGAMTGGEVHIENSKSRILRIGDADLIEVSGGSMLTAGEGSSTLGAKVLNYFNVGTDIESGGRIVLRTTAGANYPGINVSGGTHQKDMTKGPIFQFEDGTTARTYLNNFRFLNKGAATATQAWAEYRSGNITCTDIKADDTVTTLFNAVGGSGGPTTVTGVTKVPFR